MASSRLSESDVMQVLKEGRAPAMPVPQPPLSDAEAEDLAAFLDGWGTTVTP